MTNSFQINRLSAELHEALCHEQRRRTVAYLAKHPDATVAEIKQFAAPNASAPGYSRHLRQLRQVGAVKMRIDAQWRRYRLAGEMAEWLQPISQKPVISDAQIMDLRSRFDAQARYAKDPSNQSEAELILRLLGWYELVTTTQGFAK